VEQDRQLVQGNPRRDGAGGGGLNIDRLRCGWAGAEACLAQACNQSGGCAQFQHRMSIGSL
jgi:hypothetical protein